MLKKSNLRFARTRPLENGRVSTRKRILLLRVGGNCRRGDKIFTPSGAGEGEPGRPGGRSSGLRGSGERVSLAPHRRHFLRLHQHRTADHAGIVLCTFDPNFNRPQPTDGGCRGGCHLTKKQVGRIAPVDAAAFSCQGRMKADGGGEGPATRAPVRERDSFRLGTPPDCR